MKNTKQITEATVEKDGVFVYIGPSIRGVIQNGQIFSGKETEVKDKAAALAADKEHVKRLIVRDNEIIAAKAKIKKGGNSLSVAYNALANAK